MLMIGEARVGSVRDIVLAFRPSIAAACGVSVEPTDDLTDEGLRGWRVALASYVVEMVVQGTRAPALRWARRELKIEPRRWHDGGTLLAALDDAAGTTTWVAHDAVDTAWAHNVTAHRLRVLRGEALFTAADATEATSLYHKLGSDGGLTRAELARLLELEIDPRPRKSAAAIASDGHIKLIAGIWDQ